MDQADPLSPPDALFFDLSRPEAGIERARDHFFAHRDPATGRAGSLTEKFAPIGVDIGLDTLHNLCGRTVVGARVLHNGLFPRRGTGASSAHVPLLRCLLRDHCQAREAVEAAFTEGLRPAFLASLPTLRTIAVMTFLRRCWAEQRWVGKAPEGADRATIRRHARWLCGLRRIDADSEDEIGVPIQITRLYLLSDGLPLAHVVSAIDLWLNETPTPGLATSSEPSFQAIRSNPVELYRTACKLARRS